MADPRQYPKPLRSPVNTKTHGHSHLLFKALSFALFLLLLPLFPSEAPDFLNQSGLTKFWELLHLLFIGIAVSYGLFSSRRGYNETISDPQAFASGGEYSSIFDNNEKYAHYGGESTIPVSIIDSHNGYDVTVQGWNSQYFQGESNVVVVQPNQGLDFQYKPLRLPVRSLRSRVNGKGSSSCSSMNNSSSNYSDTSKIENFGDLCTVNLDEKFEETPIAMPSPIPWRSRSGSMEMREKLGALSYQPCHVRPQSVDQTQFETLKTTSFRSTMPSYSSQSSSSSHSPNRISPSHSTSSEEQSSGGEEPIQDESPLHSSPLASPFPPMKGKSPLNSLHSSQKSYASFFENDVMGKLDYNDMDETRNGDLHDFEERGRNLSNHSRHCSDVWSSEMELERNLSNHSRYCNSGSSSEKELGRNLSSNSRHCNNGSSSEKELERNLSSNSRHCKNGSSSEKELERNLSSHSRRRNNGSSSEKELERNLSSHSRRRNNGSSSEKELERNLSSHSRRRNNGSSSEKELERNLSSHSRRRNNGSSSEKELERNLSSHFRRCNNGSSSEKELERNLSSHSRHCNNGSSSEKEFERNLSSHSRHCNNGSSSEKELERNLSSHSRHCNNGSSSEKEFERNLSGHSRHCNNGSSSEKELERNCNSRLNYLGLGREENSLNGIGMGMKSLKKKLERSSNGKMRDLDEKKREDWLDRKERRSIDSSKQEMKPENGIKALLKGKSVRTFRGSCYAKAATEFAEDRENEVNENQQKIEKQEVNKKVAEEPKKEKRIEKAENLGASSDEEAKAMSNSTVNDTEPELDEVDKKAGEFIAKFREQIRLQKEASFRKSRGLHVNDW